MEGVRYPGRAGFPPGPDSARLPNPHYTRKRTEGSMREGRAKGTRNVRQSKSNRLYDELRPRIKSLVGKFVQKYRTRKYGVSYAECMSMANESFMKIVTKFASDDDDMIGRKVSRRVWYDLMEDLRTKLRTKGRLTYTPVDLEVEARPAPVFDVLDFMATLSDRGRFVVALAMHAPLELSKIVSKEKSDYESRRIKWGITRYLRDTCRWSERKVMRAFVEVREKLEVYQ